MTVTGLLARIVEESRLRIRNGEATERGLARRAGLSQPHVHNVMKGVRVLSPAAADRLMQALGIRMVDVMSGSGSERQCPVCGRVAPDAMRTSAHDLTAIALALSRELREETRRLQATGPDQERFAARPTSL